MSKLNNQRTEIHKSEPPSNDDGLMAELFDAIGFKVNDETDYNLLAERVGMGGLHTRVYRDNTALHGRCWKLGDGIEVWSILFERDSELYYADCRPGFRSRYVRTIEPWELVEYDEDGEAIVRGAIQGGCDVVFELQNLTELNPRVFTRPRLTVALAGLAYTAEVRPGSGRARDSATAGSCRFVLADESPDYADKACENDYLITGRVLAWRELRNRVTGSDLVWTYVDAGVTRTELLVNRKSLRGRLSVGAQLTAVAWLQGHVLEEAEVQARYEGVDLQCDASEFWTGLRRPN